MVVWEITDSFLFRRIQTDSITNVSPPIFSLISGLFVRNDGRKLYILGSTFTGSVSGGRVFEYNMNTAWDVSTLVYTGGSKCLNFGCDGNPVPNMSGETGLFFKDDGTRMYIAEIGRLGASKIHQYNLSSPWNVSTASTNPVVSKNVVSETGEFGAGGLSFKPDGSKMYLTKTNFNESIIEYNLSTPWALNTASPTGNTFEYDTVLTFPPGNPGFTGLSNVGYTWFREDGLRAFVGGTNRMRTLNMTVPFDLSTMSQDNNSILNTIGINTVPQIFFFKPDGSRWFLLGGGGTGFTLNDIKIRIGEIKSTGFFIDALLGPKTQFKTFNLNAFIQPIIIPLKESLIETWDEYPLGSIFDKRDNANNNMRFDGQSAGPRGWTVMKTFQHVTQGPRADGPPTFTSGPVWEVVDDTILGSRALKMQMEGKMGALGTIFGAELGQTMRMENIPNKLRFLNIRARLEDFNSTTRVGFAIRFNAKNGEGRNGGTIAVRRIWLNGSGANTSHDDLQNLGQGAYDFNTNVDLGLDNNDILELENFDIRSLFGGDYYSWTLILYSGAFTTTAGATRHKCDVRWGRISMTDIPSSDKLAFSLDAIIKEPEIHKFSLNAKLVDWHDDLGALVPDWISTTGDIRAPDLDDAGVHGTGGVSYPDLPKAAITKQGTPGDTKIAYAPLPPVNRFDNNFAFQFRCWNHQKLGFFATPIWMALSETEDGVRTATIQNFLFARQTALNNREFVMFFQASDDDGNTVQGTGRLHYPPVSDVWCRVEVRQNTAKLIIARDPTFTDQMISQRDGVGNQAVPDIVDISSLNPTPTHPTGTGKFSGLSFVQTTAGGGGSSRRELYPTNITNMTVERIAPVVFSIDAIIKEPNRKQSKINAFIQRLGENGIEGEGLKSSSINAIITPTILQTKIKEFFIEGSIQKTFGRGMTANAILFGTSGESGGIPPQEPEVNSLIKRLGENGTEGEGLKSFTVDALISDDGIKFYCMDALFKQPGQTKDYFINGLLQTTGDNGSNGGDDIDQDEDDNIITIPIGTLVGQRLTLATTPLRIITLKFTLHRDGLSGGATGTLTGKIYRNSVTGNAISGGDLIATSTNFVSVSSLTTSVTGTQVSFSFTGLAETSPNNNIFLGFDVSGSNEELFLHTESTGTAISGGDVTVESPSGFWGGNLGVDATFEMIVNQTVQNRGFAIMNTLLLKEQDTDFEINAIIVRRDSFDINAIIEIPVPKEKINEFTIDADIFDPFATSSFESVVGP